MTTPLAKAKTLFYWTKWQTQCALLEANIRQAKTKLPSPLHVQGFLEHLVFSAKVCACRLTVSIRTAIKRSRRGKRKGTGEEVECWKSFSCRCWTRRVLTGAKLRATLDCARTESIRAQFGFPNVHILFFYSYFSTYPTLGRRMFKASFTPAVISTFSRVP